LPGTAGRHCNPRSAASALPVRSFDVGRLKLLDQILGYTNAAVAEIVDVTHLGERLYALLQRRLHLLTEPLAGERDALTGHQLAIEPAHAVMTDLLVEAGGRQDADPDIRTVPREIVGLTALGEIGGDAPVIRIDPLGMTSPAQCLQPADMGANEGLGVSA
jgi:hypothetical protein